jgi:hypothetical protein
MLRRILADCSMRRFRFVTKFPHFTGDHDLLSLSCHQHIDGSIKGIRIRVVRIIK